jgi:hypothetical protein
MSSAMFDLAEVAQSVEQWTENPRVGGSIPSLGILEIKGLASSKLTPFSLKSKVSPIIAPPFQI